MKAMVKEGCISCGLCTEEFPKLFRMNDDGVAEAVAEQVPAGQENEARQAAEDCPVSVFVITE